MKLELDVKINKNGEDKINEFSVENFLEKHVKSGETNQVEEDKGNIMPKISGWAIGVMSVIVVLNLISDILQIFVDPFKVDNIQIFIGAFKFDNIQIFVRCFKISTQTNVLAVLLVVLLIINNLFEKKKQK